MTEVKLKKNFVKDKITFLQKNSAYLMIKLSVGEIVCSLSWGRGGLLIILAPLKEYL